MFYNVRIALLCMGVLLLSACQEDLLPSNDPLTSEQAAREGEIIDDLMFTLSDGTVTNLSSRLANADGVVLYFTMWCPVCDSHMNHIRKKIQPIFPNIDFIFVDYISGSIAYTQDAQQALGYSNSWVIADFDNGLENYFNGSMASTIIIDKNFIVRLNSGFKTGDEIERALQALSQ